MKAYDGRITPEQFDAWALGQMRSLERGLQEAFIQWGINDIKRAEEMNRTRMQIEHYKRMAQYNEACIEALKRKL